MSATDRMELFGNALKMKTLVYCTAQYLADCLQIVDSDIAPNCPFVELSRKELRYFLSLNGHGRFQQMESLMQMYDFVVKAEDLSRRMRCRALELLGLNIDVSEFTLDEAYFEGDELIKSSAARTTRISVGDIGGRLQKDIKIKARVWLDDLDQVLCSSSCITRTDNGTVDDVLVNVKDYLAEAISERLTLMSYEDVVNDMLSSRSLEELLNEVYRGSKVYANESKRRDVTMVEMLLVFATFPTGDKAIDLLTNRLDTLRDLEMCPPKEIESRRCALNMERLCRAFAEDLDLNVRLTLVQFWSLETMDAVNVTKQALKEILDWKPTERVVDFHSILAREGGSKLCSIPEMGFLHTEMYFACKQQERRSGLSEPSARAERLIRAVWELASRGTFSAGVIAAELVHTVTLDSILMSRMAATTITNERDVNKLGFNMFNFVQKLYNMEGDHVEALDKAACSLSKFSCRELEAVFDTRNQGLFKLCEGLTHKTRDLMTYSPKKEYASFATDTLAILLPLLHCRRNRLGIPSTLNPNPLVDILRTVPSVRRWHPTNGTLKLTLDDLRNAHRNCKEILDDLNNANVLVKKTGTVASKRKVIYAFDSLQMWKLLTLPSGGGTPEESFPEEQSTPCMSVT